MQASPYARPPVRSRRLCRDGTVGVGVGVVVLCTLRLTDVDRLDRFEWLDLRTARTPPTGEPWALRTPHASRGSCGVISRDVALRACMWTSDGLWQPEYGVLSTLAAPFLAVAPSKTRKGVVPSPCPPARQNSHKPRDISRTRSQVASYAKKESSISTPDNGPQTTNNEPLRPSIAGSVRAASYLPTSLTSMPRPGRGVGPYPIFLYPSSPVLYRRAEL